MTVLTPEGYHDSVNTRGTSKFNEGADHDSVNTRGTSKFNEGAVCTGGSEVMQLLVLFVQ